MSDRARIDFIDVCKAWGIILMVLGHTYKAPQTLYNLIFCFHMPLFFVISGYTYNRNRNDSMGFLRFAGKKARQLLIPYVVFALVNLLTQIAWKTLWMKESVAPGYIQTNLKGILFCYSSQKYMPNCTPIWFLLCLFEANLIFFWIMKLGKRMAPIAAAAGMAIAFVLSRRPYDYTTYPWKFPVFFMGAFFMYVGSFLREFADKYAETDRRLMTVSAAVLAASLGLELISGNAVGMNENEYGSLLIFLLTSIPISCSLILLSRGLFRTGSCKPLIWLGRNTLYIVGFNYLCRDLAIELYYLIPILRRHQINAAAMFLITFALCVFCAYLGSSGRRALHSRKKAQ